MKKAILLFTLNALYLSTIAQVGIRLEGSVLERESNTPVGFASVVLNTSQWGTCTNDKGLFHFTQLSTGVYRVQVSCLGYRSVDTLITLSGDMHVAFRLTPMSLAIEGVVVTAQESKQSGSTSTAIGHETMQHLQPNSLSEVLKLIPGNIRQETSADRVNLLSIRQAGSDVNTSLGASIVVDGVPMSGDATLQEPHNGSIDLKFKDRIATGKGIDLRQIPTDQIESVEVIRGIAPPRYGEVTSSVLVVKQKMGETPLAIRVKKDATTFLAHAGKGLKLGKGSLNGGADYVSSRPDPRNTFESYQRLSGSVRYQRSLTGETWHGRTSGELSVTSTLDREKVDPEEMPLSEDSYSASYSRLYASTGGLLHFEQGLIGGLEWNLAAAQVLEKTLRNRFVSPNGPTPLPIATVEGHSYGIYLPSEYPSSLTVDGRPLNVYAASTLQMREFYLGGKHSLSAGCEYRFDWNHGQGEVYDITRPPFVVTGSTTARPRKSSSIPALQKAAAYVENSYSSSFRHGNLQVRAGVRGTSLLSPPPSMENLNGRLFLDPRVNATWSFAPLSVAGTPVSVSLHAGYGIQTKLPVLSHLYPNLRYFDIVELNYFSQNPSTRSLYIKTVTQDATNPALSPARNSKVEVGITLRAGRSTLSVTAFGEKLQSGYTSQTRYIAVPYTRYISSSVDPEGLTGPPTVDMFLSEADTILQHYSMVTNGSLTHKRGVEYHLSLGRMERLQTVITLNGAWFLTEYNSSLPEHRTISQSYNNRPYPYVGIYTWNDFGQRKSLFNTNVLLDTHIPAFQLIISTTFQLVWFSSLQRILHNGMPTAYITQNGTVHEYREEYSSDPMLGLLVKKYTDRAFDRDLTPLNFLINLRLTKAIKKSLHISFYVNTIAYYQKPYTSLGVERRDWRPSAFGAEVNIKI